MSFRLLSLAFATALVFVAGPASAARIIVTIDGLKNAQGNVFIGLYASPAKFLQGNQTDAQRRVKASTAPVTVMFDNLPAGTYAVGAFHDENANDHLDTNVLGLPTEGYALSNGHGRQRRQAGRAAHPVLRGRSPHRERRLKPPLFLSVSSV